MLTISFPRDIADPGISRHENAVRMDNFGNDSGLGCEVTYLLIHSEFVSFAHPVEIINSC